MIDNYFNFRVNWVGFLSSHVFKFVEFHGHVECLSLPHNYSVKMPFSDIPNILNSAFPMIQDANALLLMSSVFTPLANSFSCLASSCFATVHFVLAG